MKENSKINPKKKVKEITEGVYINSTSIPSDSEDFEKAIEESFSKLKSTDISKSTDVEKKQFDLNQSTES
ncbi:hypothetical protein [Flavobacterium sp.]|uniref:hypothetical protein n=1 Tax=Flavobacterium sp. TaxID=239 RepID=UPI00262D137B|nr:hypothetical protein [Flavobacterium sp.]MDD3005045.1 hypothetical protein [Flavobacterium sp.]